MAEILSVISLISYILAGVCLAFAVFFWFKFKIPAVIGDLSGRTAKKSIAKMRENNEKSGKKSYRPSAVNKERDKLTGSMSVTKKESSKQKKKEEILETGLLSECKAEFIETQETALLYDGEETGLLHDENETTLLAGNEIAYARSGSHKQLLLLVSS